MNAAQDQPSGLAHEVAQTILEGFHRHYWLFRESSAKAKVRFENGDWAGVRAAQETRVRMYDHRVEEGVKRIQRKFPEAGDTDALWPQVKRAYVALLHDQKQPELAETYFNSVACRVLHRQYFHNEYLFWRPAVSTEHIEGDEPVYIAHYIGRKGLRRLLLEMVTRFRLRNRWENLRRDIRCLEATLREEVPGAWVPEPNFQVQVLNSLFFRNKAAYLVGRATNGNRELPFVIPILQNDRGEICLDAMVINPSHLSVVFSYTRAYCMVDMEVPSAYVSFLRTILPNKPKWECYTLLGLHKQGKTLFYRDLFQHMKHSTDKFVVAPGIKGMVMLVFTLPSFPYVFKLIRDRFAPPKEVTRQIVLEKYALVKTHDRVGRMADTLEYSDVALPLDRFNPDLLEELKSAAGSSIEVEGDQLVIKHMYIERRMVPLNLYMQGADEGQVRHAVMEYGNAIKELAAANIFPGDMLIKNFGVTRNGRVIFYDYDEICYMTECNFRRIPPPRSYEDEMSAEPWYNVEPEDVFPEQFPQFLFADPHARDLFCEFHGELIDADYWKGLVDKIEAGQQLDVFPYPESIRFRYRYPDGASLLSPHPAPRIADAA